MAEENKRLRSKLRVIIPAIVLGIGVIVGLRYGIDYWIYSMKHVVTDDARIKGRMVSVAPTVSAVVRELQAEEGRVVQVGDVLLELNDSDYRLQYEEAQAQAEMVEYRLQEAQQAYELHIQRAEGQILRAGAEVAAQRSTLAEERTALALERDQMQNQTAEAEAALKQAESAAVEVQGQVRVAESNRKRAQALFADGIISVENRDQAHEELGQAQARLTAAKEHVAQLRARLNNVLASRKRVKLFERKVQTGQAEVKKSLASEDLAKTEREQERVLQVRMRILEAHLRESRAKVERAHNNLKDTVLRSPIAGVISRQRVEVGQLVQRGQPVLVITNPQDVWILANIKESYIREVVLGQPVDIRVDAYPDRRFTGKVAIIGAAAISEFALFPPTGTFTKVEQRIPVQISVSNPGGQLRPGMMVVVGIVKKSQSLQEGG